MADKPKKQEQSAPPANNVTALTTKCVAQGCSKKNERVNFCAEHYEWFKFGLITKEGKHPVDFDKKMIAFKKHHKAA